MAQGPTSAVIGTWRLQLSAPIPSPKEMSILSQARVQPASPAMLLYGSFTVYSASFLTSSGEGAVVFVCCL